MSVIVEVSGKAEQAIPFPKLMTDHNGVVVYFSGPRRGQVLFNNNSGSFMDGEFREDWIMSSFIDFNSIITLRNE